jgi:C-terminal processing protease CtpA/Prc
MRTIAKGLAPLGLALLVMVSLCCVPVQGAGILGFGQSSVQTAVQQQVAAEQYYHKVWELVDQNFLYRDRLKSWDTWEHKFDGTLKNQADAEKAVRQALQSLGDPYTFFKDTSATKAQEKRNDLTGVVTWKKLPDNIGYIKITTFSSNHVGEELKAALQGLGAVDGYVLDVRENLGGYINQSLAAFSLLVNDGLYTTLKGRYQGNPFEESMWTAGAEVFDKENSTVTRSARLAGNLTGTKPLAVLVNANSASASEMLTGALRDHARAEIVGVKTYGKGIAQRTWNLDGGTSVQITFAEYFFPGGDNIHGKGITPSHEVKPSVLGDDQLDAAVKIVKSKLGK